MSNPRPAALAAASARAPPATPFPCRRPRDRPVLLVATYAHTGTAVASIISELPGERAEALFIAMAALVPTAGEQFTPGLRLRVVRIRRVRHVG